MNSFDLCLAWNWPYDSDFVGMLEEACQIRGISFFQVTPVSLPAVIESLKTGGLRFLTFFDRASDEDERFRPLVEWAQRQAEVYLNRFRTARRAWDKAAMHQLFTRAGLDAPYTLVLPSYHAQPCLPSLNLEPLGGLFAIKPAHGGGGRGVIPNACSWDQVLMTRIEYPEDQYLLQSYVTPSFLEGRPAWFRILHCLGHIYPCWWDPYTHIYSPVTYKDQQQHHLQPLIEITTRMASLCALDLFSTEIALTQDGRFVIVDYVNDPIDLRLKSKTPEWVPDEIVAAISSHLADHVSTVCQLQPVYVP